METLQLAQMLADLSSLNATEPNAAAALVNTNKAIEKVEHDQHQHRHAHSQRPTPTRTVTDELLHRPNSTQGLQLPGAGTGTGTGTGTGSNTPARFDKLGRRIFMSPPLTRTNSSQGSMPGTPRRGGESDAEDTDLDRASTLMALYEIRSKLKQQDSSSLMKAREKIADLAARQQAQAQAQGQVPAQVQMQAGKRDNQQAQGQGTNRYSYPK